MFQSPIIFWLVLAALFLALEFGTVALVSIWFVAGSMGAVLVWWLGGPMWLQVGVFLAVSGVLLALLRPILRRQKKIRTNVDSVIGAKGLVTEDIDNIAAQGQAKLGAMTWTARSTSGEPLKKGTEIYVDRIEGVKVFVSPVKIEQKV